MGRARLRRGEIGVPGAKQINKDRWDAWARFGASDGRTVRIERTGRTKAIAIRAVQEAAAARVEEWRLDGEAAAENAVPTVGQLAEDWFRSIEPPKIEVNQSGNAVEASFDTSVRRQTFDQYQSTYRNHIEAGLGQMKVSDVGVKVGSDFLFGLIDGGKGLTRARLARVVLSSILQLAVDQEVLSYNPVRNIKPLPKRKAKPKALNEPSLDEVRSAVRSWRNQPGTFGPPNDGTLADIVDLMLATGTRIGEVLAFRWNDLDLVSPVPTVSITGTLIEPRHGPKYRQPVPKSKGSIRKIPLPQFAVDVLLRRRACSPVTNTVNAVFWSRNGTFMQPSSVRRSLRSALSAAGVEFDFKVTPHTFRKTVATLLAREAGKGAARSVIGHSKEETTDRYYIEPITQVEDHRDLIDGAFGRRADGGLNRST